jgi:surface antigen
MSATSLLAGIGYQAGQCTAWVQSLTGQMGWTIPTNLGNADTWLTNAQKDGLTTIGPTATPPVGSIAVWAPNTGGALSDGHVAVVQAATGGKVVVSEMNWTSGPGKSDTRSVDPSQIEGYIVPPNAAQSATLTDATTSWVDNIPVVGGVISTAASVTAFTSALFDPATYLTLAWFIAAGILIWVGFKLITRQDVAGIGGGVQKLSKMGSGFPELAAA